MRRNASASLNAKARLVPSGHRAGGIGHDAAQVEHRGNLRCGPRRLS